jgi:beta-hydroxylase
VPAALHYLLQPTRLVLLLFAASAGAVQLRGRTRLGFRRQLGDHSTITAPYNLLVYLHSRVPNQAFLDLGRFPDLHGLADHWAVFREEALRLATEARIGVSTADNDIGFHTFFRRGWKRFYLMWYGEPLPSARTCCPRTLALLAEVPAIRGAMFALLPPGGRLGRHRDPFAGSLRYHLGLATPNDDACWIEVDGERRSWRDGQAMLFDETFVHEALNDTTAPRLILLCDVERPLIGAMARINRWVSRHVMGASATQNEPGEPIGALNRFYARVARVQKAGRALKARNRRLYYAIKHTLTLAVLALLLWP